MSDFNRQGIKQFEDDKAKESKENNVEKDLNKFSASEYGQRTERYNANEKKAQVPKKTEEQEEKTYTKQQMDKQDMADDLEEAYINNKAKPIAGLRRFDENDKREARRLYEGDKKFISIPAMGVSIENGHGLIRGGFNRINFLNESLGQVMKKPL